MKGLLFDPKGKDTAEAEFASKDDMAEWAALLRPGCEIRIPAEVFAAPDGPPVRRERRAAPAAKAKRSRKLDSRREVVEKVPKARRAAPAVDDDAPWGRKADGTPKGKPGRRTDAERAAMREVPPPDPATAGRGDDPVAA